MRKFLRILRIVAVAAVVLAIGVFLLNTNLLVAAGETRPLLIAHRGLGQAFSRAGLTGTTCTAAQMLPPEHPYLENTIDGFRAAFAAGADIVEFDVHPTTDGDFAVFHDWTLDCRTDGTGVTREHSMAELKALDIGYGYTADGGATHPFRGTGIGLMPALGEVLAAFPDRRFLINVKSDDAAEGEALAARIGALPEAQRANVMVYGGGAAMDAYRSALPAATVLGTDGAKRCVIRYALLGWSTYVPQDCRNTLVLVPADFAPYAWGYPHRLAARLKAAGSMLVLLGDYDGSGFTSGVDDAGTLARLPVRFDGAIWTNRIDLIGPRVLAAAGG